MTTIKILMLIAVLGHILCGICDCLLIYTPSGKFGFQLMKDNGKMQEAFRTMPLRNPMLSMLLGVLALLMSCGGYFALCLWMRRFSVTASVIMLAAAAVFFIPGTAHHVICGVAEWFYIRMGMTEEAREAITEFFGKTSVTICLPRRQEPYRRSTGERPVRRRVSPGHAVHRADTGGSHGEDH